MSTKFAFEVPHAHLEEFEDLQDFHFILSIHYNNKRYKEFYLDQALNGLKRVWLDNGFNEKGKADSVSTLVRYFIELHADKVIAPDATKWDPTKLLASFHRMARYVPTNKIIMVANSPIAVDMAYIHNIRNIAIPFRLRPTWPSEYKNRLEGHHFLGLNSIDEIREFKPSTLDTSIPIRLAMKRMTMRSWHEGGCNRKGLWHKDMPGYYDIVMTKYQLALARHNIMELKEVGQ
jgi:hypothetical protein